MWSLLPYLWITILSVESATFQIVYNDRTIGEMVATRERVGDQEIYRNTTTVRTRIIRQIEVQYQSRVVFKNGILQEASVHSLLNGDEYDNVETRKVGNDYNFLKNGKLKHTLEGPITYSALQMLFEEPKGISVAYSEEAGGFHTIESNDIATYNKVNSKGRTNYYYYAHQFLEKIEIDAGLVKFDMIRKP